MARRRRAAAKPATRKRTGRFAFIEPPAPKASAGMVAARPPGAPDQATGQGGQDPTPPAYSFIAPQRPPTFRDLVPERFTVPPREVCEHCGAAARVEGAVIVSELHTGDCPYVGWPRRVEVDDEDKARAERPWPYFLRPTMARELGLAADRCGVCRAHVTGEVEHDKGQHAWWCTWWPAHPGVTPF